MGSRSGYNFELLLPFYADAEALYFDLGRQVSQNATISGVEIERGRYKQ